MLTALALAPVALGLGAMSAGPMLRAALRAPTLLPVVMMAKNKKGKMDGADAWEPVEAEDEDEGDGPTPGTAAGEKKAKKPKKSGLSPAALAALQALQAMEAAGAVGGRADDPLAPVAPTKKLKRKDLIAPPPPVAAPRPVAAPPAVPAGPTLAEKLRAVCEQLGVDASMPIPAALKACNEAMGIAGSGPLLAQADELVAQLGLSFGAPAAAARPAPVVASAPAPVAAAAPAAPAVRVVAQAEADVAAAAGVKKEEREEEEKEEAEGTDGDPVLRLSKNKMKKERVESEGPVPGTDASGRRGMGTRIQRFDDAEPGYPPPWPPPPNRPCWSHAGTSQDASLAGLGCLVRAASSNGTARACGACGDWRQPYRPPHTDPIHKTPGPAEPRERRDEACHKPTTRLGLHTTSSAHAQRDGTTNQMDD